MLQTSKVKFERKNFTLIYYNNLLGLCVMPHWDSSNCSAIILLIKTLQVDIASRLFWRTVVKMQVPIVTIEGNIGAGKTTLLQKFEQSLSSEDKVTIKVENESVKELQSFLWKWSDKSTGILLWQSHR